MAASPDITNIERGMARAKTEMRLAGEEIKKGARNTTAIPLIYFVFSLIPKDIYPAFPSILSAMALYSGLAEIVWAITLLDGVTRWFDAASELSKEDQARIKFLHQ